MRFKLPIPVISREIYKIILREVKKQKIYAFRPTKNELKEIAQVLRAIAKQGLPKHLLCKKLPGKLGYGIFLHPQAKPILKGQIIAPYAGEISFAPQNVPDEALYAFELFSDILLTKEEQARYDGKRSFHPRRLYAIHIDALKKGNFTRFVNHSAQPNLAAEFFRIPSNPYGLAPSFGILYLAKKTIQPGEQLLVSYDGDDSSYWNVLGIKPLPITPKTYRVDSFRNVINTNRKK